MTTDKNPFSTVSAVFAFRKFNVEMPVQTRQVIRLSSLHTTCSLSPSRLATIPNKPLFYHLLCMYL